MTTVGGSTPAIFSTSAGDGQGVTISSVTRFRDRSWRSRPRSLHGSLASLDQANATMQQVQSIFNEPSDSGIGAQLSRLLVVVRRRRQQPGRSRRRARCSCRTRRPLAASFNAVSVGAAVPAHQRDHAARRGRGAGQLDLLEPRQAQHADPERNGRRAQRRHAPRPARPARAAAGRAHGRDDPDRPEQHDHGLARRAEPRVGEPVAGVDARHERARPPCCAAAQGGFAVNVTSGQAGGMLNDINTVMPGLPHAARRCRDDAARPGERRDERDRGLDRRDRAGPERGGHAAVRCRARRRCGQRRSRSPAPTGRARAARPRCRPRCRPRSTPPIGAGNATATVTTNVDGSLSVSVTPTGTHALQVQASGANAGYGHAARQHRRRHRRDRRPGRSSPAPTPPRSRSRRSSRATRPRSRPAPSANGPLDASIALRLGDHVDVHHRRRRHVQHDDRAAGCRPPRTC